MKIFISYHHLDRPLVDALEHDLNSLGHNVWFDQELTGGQDWWDTICAAIRDCDVLVIALTPRWLNSKSSHLEFEYATACRRVIVPIMLTHVDEASLPAKLAKLQYVKYTSRTREEVLSLARAFALHLPVPLPDPLPAQPPAPISALNRMRDRINAPNLSRDEQLSLVFDLSTLMAGANTKAQAKDYIDQLLARRSELYADIAANLQAIRGRSLARLFAVASVLILMLVVGGLVLSQRINTGGSGTPSATALTVTETATQARVTPPTKTSPPILPSATATRTPIPPTRTPTTTDTPVPLTPTRTYTLIPPTATNTTIPPSSTSALRLPLIFGGHTGEVTSVAFAPDGKTILTGSGDHTARLWDVQSGQTIHIFTGHTDWIRSVAFAPDGKTILTGSDDETARLWDMQSGQTLHIFTGHTSFVWSVAFSPDGKYILTGSYDKTARLWDVQSGRSLYTFGHTGAVTGVAFSSDGKTILTGSNDGTALLWDVQSVRAIQTFTGHTGAVTSVAFSSDGKTILTGSSDKTAILWNINGEILHTLNWHMDWVQSVAFAPDGKTVLTGSDDKTARLRDVSSGQTLYVFTGHTGRVTSVAFAPDGKSILTGSSDKMARLWDISSLVSEP